MELQNALRKAAHKAVRATKLERRLYSRNGIGGCVEQRRNRTTGNLVGVYECGQSGIDGGEYEADKPNPWATVCEKHGHIIGHRSLGVARSHAADPLGWCDTCREKSASNN